ncbi:CHASE domain-containing protein [Altererythrobacter sp. MF3-039]|uniref:CHASE domain-containing protein n=1 Tax=Altererythrobacter sp. MF3-039 TaxID=3252901 RepID=UPI00390CCB6A
MGEREEGFSQRRGRRWLIKYPRVIPAAIFLAVAAIVAVAVVAIELTEIEAEKASMSEVSQAVASALERRSDSTSSYLRAGAALLETSDEVTPVDFLRIVSAMRLDTIIQGTDGIGWAKALRPNEVAEYEARMRAYGFGADGVSPKPARGTERVVPVTFLLPATDRNRRAFGFDMYSEPVRRAAMDQAANTGMPKASGQIVLKQEGGNEAPGFLIYMPVFDGKGMNRQLRGFIYVPINAQQFFDAALDMENPGDMGLSLYESELRQETLMASLTPEFSTGKQLVEQVIIADRTFFLVVESSRKPRLSFVSMLTLLFGVAVASLLMLVARLMTQNAVEDQATVDWLEHQHSIRNTLTRELNHRVKNTLANVLSIAAMTRRRSTTLDEFAERLEGRIRALSATHDLLTQSEWGTTPIREIVEAELKPYEPDSQGFVVVEGPEVEIAPNDALSLGLALHELATNAVKYGALSQPEGRVNLTWRLARQDLVELSWEESGGPVVSNERTRGFGTDLIEKIVAHELKHPVELDFAPTGVRCKLLVPVRKLGQFEIRARQDALKG